MFYFQCAHHQTLQNISLFSWLLIVSDYCLNETNVTYTSPKILPPFSSLASHPPPDPIRQLLKNTLHVPRQEFCLVRRSEESQNSLHGLPVSTQPTQPNTLFLECKPHHQESHDLETAVPSNIHQNTTLSPRPFAKQEIGETPSRPHLSTWKLSHVFHFDHSPLHRNSWASPGWANQDLYQFTPMLLKGSKWT